MKINKTYLILIGLVVAGFLYRAYPHMFLVPRWMQEEESQWAVIKELVETGTVFYRAEFQPILSHYLIYYLTRVLPIDPIMISQYFTSVIGSLCIIPLYLLMKLHTSTKKSLLVCGIFTFSEVMFYKSAKLAPETVSLFFMFWAIYFYERSKKRMPYFTGTIFFSILTFYTHLIPLIFGVTVIFVDGILFASKKRKILLFVLAAGFALLLFSPLSSAGKAGEYLNPSYLLSKLNLANIINLYSLAEIISWSPTFAGTLCIFALFAYLLLENRLKILSVLSRQPNIIVSLFVASVTMFVFTWIGHNAAMFSPIRILMYLVLPIIYIIVNTIRKPLTLLAPVLIAIMVFSSYQLCYTSLWIDSCTTLDEYRAMEELIEFNIFHPTESLTKWFVDVSAEYMMVPYLEQKWAPTVDPDVLLWNYDNATVKIYYTRAEGNYSAFKHVYISERMEKGALFRNWQLSEIFSGRKGKFTKPVIDTLASNPHWVLVYNNYGVKVYEPRLYEE